MKESAIHAPVKSPKKTTTSVYFASRCKDIAKDLGMTREQVLAVYYAIPHEIVNLLLEKKRVIFDNLGSFTPRKMKSNLPAVEETYKIAFKPSEKTRKLMLLLRTKEKE